MRLYLAQLVTKSSFQNSIRVRQNMEYNYDDSSEIPNLEDFKEELIEEILMSVFFRKKSDHKINMLKLPIISAPSLLRKQVNNDILKQTLMEKEFSYQPETLQTFMSLVDSNVIKLNQISDLTVSELTHLSKQLDIYSAKKSGEVMKNDMINLSKTLLAGQV